MSQYFRAFKTGAAGALLTLAALGSGVQAQPSFGNPSPTAGTSTSDKANAAADAAAYREVEYTNKNKRGPALIVIPGEIKSSNASFTQRFLPNNIADFAELELSQANFPVLERTNIGPLLNEISLAYNLGDPNAARKTMQMGKLKTTKWVVKFDILKAEQIAENKKGFDGRAVGSLLNIFGGGSMAGGLVMGRAAGAGVALGGMLLAMLVSLVLTVPLFMGIWFAPALVLFNNMHPVDAIKASFNACLKNVVPFLVFWVITLVLIFFAALPVGLGFLVLIPVLAGSVYASYRDIFVAN